MITPATMPHRLPQRPPRASRRGFTLIEMMVAAGILLFVLVGISQLSIVTADNATQAVMTTESARWAQSLVEEQISLGYTAQVAGTSTTSTYTPVQGKTITGVLTVTDTSGAQVAGTTNIGVQSLLVRASTTWRHPWKGTQTYAYQVYMSPPAPTQ